MNEWLIALITVACSTIISTVVGLVIKRSFDKFFIKKEKEEKEKEEQIKRLKEFESQKEREEHKKDIREAIEEAIAPIKQDLSFIKKGTQAGLRHDLCLMADEWLVKGYCPRDVKVDFENLYTQYHNLGKNGVMDSTFQSMLALPDSKPKTTRKTNTKKKITLNETV